MALGHHQAVGPDQVAYLRCLSVGATSAAIAVGRMVADREISALAGRLIEETCHKQGVQPQVLNLHSDRGAPID